MELEIKDCLIYKGVEYEVSGVEHPDGFFRFEDYGLEPVTWPNGSERKYHAFFTVSKKNRLLLKSLETNAGLRPRDKPEPLIYGCRPRWQQFSDRTHQCMIRWLHYEYILQPMTYSGSLLLTRDFNAGTWQKHRALPTGYEKVLVLRFQEGRLVSEADLSEIARAAQEGRMATAKGEKVRLTPPDGWGIQISEWLCGEIGKIIAFYEPSYEGIEVIQG